MSIARRRALSFLPFLSGLLHNTARSRCFAVITTKHSRHQPCSPGYVNFRSLYNDHTKASRNALIANQARSVNWAFQLHHSRQFELTDSTAEVIAEKTGISPKKSQLLNLWLFSRYRCCQLAAETAEMLTHQEEYVGENLPIHLVESERDMNKRLRNMAERNGTEVFIPPKLSEIGRISTQALTNAVSLMAEDKWIRANHLHSQYYQNESPLQEVKEEEKSFHGRVIQHAEFATYWYEVAAYMGSIEAALYLVRISSHPLLRKFWSRSMLSGPKLDLAKRMIENEVTQNAQTCDWNVFSTYMDLFYSAEELKTRSNRADAHYFLVGIMNMLYRIKHTLFRTLDLEPHQPRVHPPHKHLLRIVDHCLQNRCLVLERYPRDKLKEIRQEMLKALAENFQDCEANFTLAIELGDWKSKQLIHYLSKSLSKRGDEAHPLESHAAWLIFLRLMQEIGVLTKDFTTIPPPAAARDTSAKSIDVKSIDTSFTQLGKEAICRDAATAEETKPETWLFNRALAYSAIVASTGGSDTVHKCLQDILMLVKPDDELSEARKPYLRDQIRKLEDHLEESRSDDPKTLRWQQKKLNEALQQFADPEKLIRHLQKKIVVE